MSKENFVADEWVQGLSTALKHLKKVQVPFLNDYWKANSFPISVSFNGRDETPFPSDDLYQLYEMVRHEKRLSI